MATEPGTRAGHPTIDPDALYREEIYTDRAMGLLRVMHPVSSDGKPDPSRPTIYTGEAQLMTNVGPLPIAFDVPGATREALKVSVEGRRVTLATVAPQAAEAGADAKETAPAADAAPAERPLYRERTAAVFARTVSLPAEVDQQASQARFESGVLTLVLAKKVATGATQLQIA